MFDFFNFLWDTVIVIDPCAPELFYHSGEISSFNFMLMFRGGTMAALNNQTIFVTRKPAKIDQNFQNQTKK